MRAGRLRHRVTFQARAPGRDAEGQPNGEWNNVATVWADVEDLTGRELIRGGVASGEITTRITCRWRPDINATMRALHRDRTLEIVAPPIDAEGRGRQLEIMAREIHPQEPTP